MPCSERNLLIRKSRFVGLVSSIVDSFTRVLLLLQGLFDIHSTRRWCFGGRNLAKSVKFRSTNLRKLPLIRFMKLGRHKVWGFAHHPLFGCPDNCLHHCPAEPAVD